MSVPVRGNMSAHLGVPLLGHHKHAFMFLPELLACVIPLLLGSMPASQPLYDPGVVLHIQFQHAQATLLQKAKICMHACVYTEGEEGREEERPQH